jgi:adenylylsulfate kinase-like enzyme
MILVFMGQPTSGKTTLCKALFTWIKTKSNFPVRTHYLDGDKLRLIFQNKNYSREGRMQNLALASNISKYEKSLNDIVIMALVYPYKEAREFLRSLGENVVFVYLHYDKNENRGREKFWVEDFESPIGEENVYPINTSEKNEEMALREVIEIYKSHIRNIRR